MVGKSLSHYNIVEELGRGGMGIVYKAEDTKLDRTVAIKVLPPHALTNEDDRERFYREAKAAAQLHHPHIASVFEIDEAIPEGESGEARPFIAMEFIDGGTLRDEIEKGPMKLKEAVRIASQVAEALKLAHSKEIVHRDIKSHNVMLTADGDAKVLDFGLAKTAQSTMLTRMGSTLGTVAYMSPEQARGDDVDHRSDIWSLGVMLFEMVAGRLPFAGEYEKAVMYGILNEMAPPLTSLRTGVPMGLEWIVSKCLAKDPNERYQACADLIVDLKTVDLSASGLSRHSASAISAVGVPVEQKAKSAVPISTLLMALLLPLGLALGWVLFAGADSSHESSTPARKMDLVIDDVSQFGALQISHDGTLLIGSGFDQEPLGIMSIDLRTGEKNVIVGGVNTGHISISQDDQWIAYGSAGQLHRVRIQGGAPFPLASYEGYGGSVWMPDGSLIASMNVDGQRGLWKIPASGDSPIVLALADSSQGQIYFSTPTQLGSSDEILVTAPDPQGSFHLGAVNYSTGAFTSIGALGSPVAYLNSGHLIYFETNANSGRLLARSFDAEKLKFSGQPITVEENADRYTTTVDRFGTYYSETLSGAIDATISEARLYVNGEVAETYLDDLPFILGGYQPRLSPDGSKVMLRMSIDNEQQLHELNLERGIVRQFTVKSDGDADNAAYSSDASELIFELDNKLFRRNANGSGQTVEIETINGTGAMDWARSGDWLVQTTVNISGFSELIKIDLTTGESIELDGGEGIHGWPRISPDERFISYSTQGPEGRSIWVLSVEDGNRFKIAEKGAARFTAWSRDGSYLFYEGSSGLYRVPISLDPFFDITGPEETVAGPEVLEFDVVSKGDSVFAIASPLDLSGGSVTISVITDWMNELRVIAPAVD